MTTGTRAHSAFAAYEESLPPASFNPRTDSSATGVGQDRITHQEDADSAITDAQREERIALARKHLEHWHSVHADALRRREFPLANRALDNARRAMSVMYRLIGQRSPEQVARMEKERGLA